jgi:hypothetical protein
MVSGVCSTGGQRDTWDSSQKHSIERLPQLTCSPRGVQSACATAAGVTARSDWKASSDRRRCTSSGSSSASNKVKSQALLEMLMPEYCSHMHW